MTEDEAKTKWCPMARPDNQTAANRRYVDGEAMKNSRCLGSGCMMWRWSGKTTGYCGLAGVVNS